MIIERHITEGRFYDYLTLIRSARKQASTIDGFIAGELLQERANSNCAFIISSWENYESWKSWENSGDRKAILAELRPLLQSDEKITILEGTPLLQ